MIFVTGGTGFIGRKLVAALVASDRAVRVLCREPARGVDFPPVVEVRPGNLLDPGSLDAALGDVTAIVHLAGSLPGATPAPEMFRVNVEGTRNLACAARDRGIAAFVHISSAGVYGDGTTDTPHGETAFPAPRSEYERSKFESERALIETLNGSDVRWVILRPSGVHGPGRPATLAFYRMIQRKRLWIHGPARVVVHPTYIDDVIQGIRLVLDRSDLGGETFNIGGERAMTYPELVETVARALNRRIAQVRPLPGVIRSGARLLERGSRAVGLEPSYVIGRLVHPILNRAVDTSKARLQLGFQPVVLEPSIQDTVEWFRQEGLL